MISAVLFLLAGFFAPMFDLPDVTIGNKHIYEKTVKMKIKGSKLDNYKITSEINVKKIFSIGKKSLPDFEYIHDPLYAEVNKVKAYLNDERIDNDYIGKFSRLSRDHFFSDNITHFIKYPFEVDSGDTLSYSYTEKHEWFHYPAPIPIPNADSINKLIIEVEHPKNVKVDFDLLKYRDDLEFEIYYPDDKHTGFKLTPSSQGDVVDYYEYNRFIGEIFIHFETEEMNHSPNTFEGFVDWYSEMTELYPRFENFVDTALLDQIKAIETPDEKIQFINRYVRENYRYVSIARFDHSLTPFKPDYIKSLEYGDCKDRGAIVSALAALVDLDVYMAVVTADPFHPVDFIHPGLFNHVISCYINGADTIFFDPTSRYTAYPLLPEYLVGKRAVVLKDEPFQVKLSTPVDPYTMKIDIDLDYDSLENASAKFYLRNFYHRLVMDEKSKLTGNKLQNFFDGILSSQIQKISFSDYQIDTVGDYEAVVSAKADLSSFIISSTSKKYIPKTVFAAFDSDLADRSEDDLDVHFIARKLFYCDIKIKNFNDSLDSDSLLIDNGDIGYASSEAITNDSSLTVSYKFHRPLKSISGLEKEGHIEFCREYNRQKTNMYILRDRGEQ